METKSFKKLLLIFLFQIICWQAICQPTNLSFKYNFDSVSVCYNSRTLPGDYKEKIEEILGSGVYFFKR